MVKVLIARNLHDLLKQGSSFLERSDVRVYVVDCNDGILQTLRSERVDLIITQIDMPGTNSEQLFKAIRADRSLQTVPVIMVCTNSPGEIEKCARCGANDVILRPVNQRLLLARAQQFLALFTREASRIAVSMDVEFTHAGSSCRGQAIDIGAAGMMFETEHVLSRGDRIVCSFSLPGSVRIRIGAEVVNITQSPRDQRNRRYGVHFAELAADDKKRLQEFIAMKSRVAA